MTAIIVKTVGTSSRNFSTLQLWEDGAPANLTTCDRWTANTFTGTFQQGETVTGTGLTAGKFLDGNGSTYVVFEIVTGNTATLVTLTGSTSLATCMVSTKTDTDAIWQGQCYKDTTFSGAGPLLTIAGTTTSTTAYKELTTGAGQSFIDNANVQTNALKYNTANGVAITSTGAYGGGATILATENNARISKLQVEKTANSACISNNATNVTGVIVDFCILEGQGLSSPVLGNPGGGAGWKARNCLIVARASSTPGNIVTLQDGLSIYNCTLISSVVVATVAFTGNYGTPIVENCGFFNIAGVKTGTNTPTYTTCYTNVSSPPTGCTTVTYDTSTGSGFQNITDSTRDFRIKSGSALLNVGTTDSTNAATDIAGTSRPQGASYDVGAWELVSSGAIIVSMQNMMLMGVA